VTTSQKIHDVRVPTPESPEPMTAVVGDMRSSRRLKTILPAASIVLVLGLLGIGAAYASSRGSLHVPAKTKVTPITTAPTVTKPAKLQPAPTPPAGSTEAKAFEAQATQILARYPSLTIGVSAYDFTDKYAAEAGSPDRMVAASTAKLITVSAYMNLVETGQRSLDTVVDGITAQEHIRRMLVNSDNNSWNDLNGNIGVHNVEAYAAKNLGIANYNRPSNLLSAAEINSVLVQIYGGGVMNAEHLQLVLGYMALANYRQFIYTDVPAGYTVYHKAGIYAGSAHDAAIIVRDSDHKALALTIFTSSTSVSPGSSVRTQAMADLTAAALSIYFGS
jgi:beta-lactamase class A